MRFQIACPTLAVLALSLPLAAVATEPARQHDAHVHGHGQLNLVLDGRALTAELIVPAFDLVGFEHAPATDAEKQAHAAAVARLKDPVALFGLPADAACKLDNVEVEAAAMDGNEHHEDEKPAGADAAKHGEEKAEAGEHAGDDDTHSEFYVTYTLTCAKPEAFQGLNLTYFKAFERAAELEVQAVGPWGETGAELTPASTRVSF